MSVELPVVFHPEGEPYKFVAALKQRILKSFRWTSLWSLEDSVCLAYCLYIAGREEQALEVCRFLGQIPPSNKAKSMGTESRIWGWIQKALALQARLASCQEMDVEAASCRERMRSVSPFEHSLTGTVLQGYEANVNHVLDDATYSEPRERSWRLSVLIELMVMIELGVSPNLTTPPLEEKLAETRLRLQEMICRPVKRSV